MRQNELMVRNIWNVLNWLEFCVYTSFEFNDNNWTGQSINSNTNNNSRVYLCSTTTKKTEKRAKLFSLLLNVLRYFRVEFDAKRSASKINYFMSIFYLFFKCSTIFMMHKIMETASTKSQAVKYFFFVLFLTSRYFSLNELGS